MKEEINERKELCAEFTERLEDLPAEVRPAEGPVELESRLSAAGIEHARQCAACLEAAEAFWASRELLTPLRKERAEAPWFAAQVMAKIASREIDARRERMEWSGAVARLASRLAWVSAVALLLAGTWIYDGRLKAPVGQMSADAAPQSLFDSSGTAVSADEALANTPDKAQ
jgi:hypothetical protein